MRRLAPQGQFPESTWIQKVQRLEMLGYSSFLITDHFNNQWEPVATLGAIAMVTSKLKLGTLVFCVDYRHPTVLAQAGATLHLLSQGRYEFGIGAGWTKKEFEQSGFPYNKASVRIERLEETLQAIKSLWIQKQTTFKGKYIHLSNYGPPAELPEGEFPPIIVGGGGKKLLSVAGRHADIVSIVPSWPKGRVTEDNLRAHTIESIQKRIDWVKSAAIDFKRNPDEIEFNTLYRYVAITEDKQSAYKECAKMLNISTEVIAENPFFLIGSVSEIREEIKELYKDLGISYFIISGDLHEFNLIEEFANSILQPLKQGLS